MITKKEHINFLINNNIKSSTELEYADAELLDISSEKKIERLSILFTSFANAQGGTVIFGIETARNRPKEIKLVDAIQYSSLWFEFFINNYCKPTILPDVEISHIEMNGEQNKTLIAVNIKSSTKAPFMAIDKRFYRRQDTKAVAMEEYEIRDMYNKSKHPELDLFAIANTGGIPILEQGLFERITFYPRFMIKNISNAVETNYKVELFLPSALQNANYDPLQQYFSRMEDEFSVFSVTGKNPLFQNELATIIDGQFIVDKNNFDAFAQGEIILKVYYSKGVKSKHFKLKSTFLYRSNELNETDFVNLIGLER